MAHAQSLAKWSLLRDMHSCWQTFAVHTGANATSYFIWDDQICVLNNELYWIKDTQLKGMMKNDRPPSEGDRRKVKLRLHSIEHWPVKRCRIERIEFINLMQNDIHHAYTGRWPAKIGTPNQNDYLAGKHACWTVVQILPCTGPLHLDEIRVFTWNCLVFYLAYIRLYLRRSYAVMALPLSPCNKRWNYLISAFWL